MYKRFSKESSLQVYLQAISKLFLFQSLILIQQKKFLRDGSSISFDINVIFVDKSNIVLYFLLFE